MLGWQATCSGCHRIPDRKSSNLRSNRPAFLGDGRPSGTMNRPAHSSTRQQPRICGIYNGIGSVRSDVPALDANFGITHSQQNRIILVARQFHLLSTAKSR
jgi:hypothetical protein